MKNIGWCAILGLFILWLVFPVVPSLAGDEPSSKNNSESPQKEVVKKGNTKAKDSIIGGFINELEAQSGKAISVENAALLIALAKAL